MNSGIELDTILDQAAAWKDERIARQEEEGIIVRFEPVENTRRWSDFLGEALVPVADLLGGVPTLRLPIETVKKVQSGKPLRKVDLRTLDPESSLSFRPGDQMVLQDADGLRGVAVVRATCSSESLARRESQDIVLDVERVLR